MKIRRKIRCRLVKDLENKSIRLTCDIDERDVLFGSMFCHEKISFFDNRPKAKGKSVRLIVFDVGQWSLPTIVDLIRNEKSIDQRESLVLSFQLKQSQVNIVSNIKKTVKPEENITVKVIKTVIEDVQVVKKPIVSNASLENDFDLAAKNFVEWIDKIERILEEKHDQSIDVARRQEIVEDIKTKYFSYNDQFQNLVQNGNALTKQMKDGKSKPIEWTKQTTAIR